MFETNIRQYTCVDYQINKRDTCSDIIWNYCMCSGSEENKVPSSIITHMIFPSQISYLRNVVIHINISVPPKNGCTLSG